MILNTVMTLLLASMFFLTSTGIIFHEIGGVILAVLIAAHLALNSKWIKVVTGQIANGTVKPKTTFSYILNALTLLGFVIVGVTGILISQVILPAQTVSLPLIALHKFSAYASLILCCAHVLLHARYIAVFFKGLVSDKYARKAWGVVSSFAALAIIFGVLFNQIASGMDALPSSVVQTTTSQQLPEKREDVASSSYSDKPIQPPQSIEQITQESTQETTVTEEEKSEPEQTIQSQPSASVEPEVTLVDYLGNLNCTGCGRHCSLLSLQCGRGQKYLTQATTQYEQQYNVSTSAI